MAKSSPNFPHIRSSTSQPALHRSNSLPNVLYSSAEYLTTPQRQVAAHLSGSRLGNRLACLYLLTYLFLFDLLYPALSRALSLTSLKTPFGALASPCSY